MARISTHMSALWSHFMRFKSRSNRVPRQVVVWERAGAGWKVLLGEIGTPVPRVLQARAVGAEDGSELSLFQSAFSKASETILVVRSLRSVCRELELPLVSDADIQRIITLRLESELPYAASEAAWAYQRQDGSEEQRNVPVLLVAVPADDIAAAEQELEAYGQSCRVVESCEAALAQVAVILAPGADAVAVADIQTGSATLAVARGGRLGYARHIQGRSVEAGGSISEDAEASRIASEIDQSLRHYSFGKGTSLPQKLLLVGEPVKACRVAAALEEHTELSVEMPRPPEWLHFGEEAGEPEEVLGRFAPCVGALVAAHRRSRKEELAAPPLRLAGRHVYEPAVRRRVALVSLSILLAIALVAGSFGVRLKKLDTATRAVRKAQNFLQHTERLEEQVSILQRESDIQRPAIDVLLAVAEALPQGVIVGYLDIGARGNVSIRGSAPSVEVVAQAVSALVKTGKFAETRMGRAAQEKDKVLFHITCTVRSGGP